MPGSLEMIMMYVFGVRTSRTAVYPGCFTSIAWNWTRINRLKIQIYELSFPRRKDQHVCDDSLALESKDLDTLADLLKPTWFPSAFLLIFFARAPRDD
jgi:hypothetical protein